MSNDDLAIAIIGMNVRFPGAQDVNQFWKNLCQGTDSTNCSLDNIDLFDAQLFSYSASEAALIDPQHRILLQCAYALMADAGYMNKKYSGSVGIFCGAGFNSYLVENLLPLFADNQSSASLAMMLHANSNDYLASRIAYKLNLKGPCLSIQTACSSSLVAVHVACQNLLTYQCDMAIAGGVSIVSKNKLICESGGMLSPDSSCRAFDAKANGTVFNSGAGVVLLKRVADAIKDNDTIYAIIKGSAINNDGSQKVGFTAPSLVGQESVIKDALFNADVHPETINFIETHGTATALGDYIEFSALLNVFKTKMKLQQCALGAVKTNIGHLLAAAGIAGLVKTVLSLYYRKIPAMVNYLTPNNKIGFTDSPFYINTSMIDWQPLFDNAELRAGVSSFGIGGTNAHVILESAQRASSLDHRLVHGNYFNNLQRYWIERKEVLATRPAEVDKIFSSQDDITTTIRAIWSQGLGVDPIELDADFFALGGHSLLATQITAQINEIFPVNLSPDQIFELSSIRTMTTYIEQQLLEQLDMLNDVDAESEQ